MYKIFEHTADVGIEVESDSLEHAFEEAALGMFDLMIDVKNVDCVEKKVVEIDAKDLDSLLVKFLSELLYLLDSENFVICDVYVKLYGNKLIAELKGEKYSRDKHGSKAVIKAVTYHMLNVDPSGKIRVLFDI